MIKTVMIKMVIIKMLMTKMLMTRMVMMSKLRSGRGKLCEGWMGRRLAHTSDHTILFIIYLRPYSAILFFRQCHTSDHTILFRPYNTIHLIQFIQYYNFFSDNTTPPSIQFYSIIADNTIFFRPQHAILFGPQCGPHIRPYFSYHIFIARKSRTGVYSHRTLFVCLFVFFFFFSFSDFFVSLFVCLFVVYIFLHYTAQQSRTECIFTECFFVCLSVYIHTSTLYCTTK